MHRLAPAAFLLPLLIFFASALSPASAATKEGSGDAPPPPSHPSSPPSSPAPTTATVRGRLRLPDPTSPPLNSTRVTLDGTGGLRGTYTQPDGSFVFHRVPPGVHLLDVQCRQHHFGQVKIQLLPESMDSPKCIEYAYPGAPKQAVPHPLELTAHASYEYFEPRKGLGLLGMLGNPMFLMMALSVGGMFLMPKMMEGMDPEQKEQMQKQMAMQQDPTKMLTQMFQDLTGKGEEPAPPPVERKPSSKAGGKTARRAKRD